MKYWLVCLLTLGLLGCQPMQTSHSSENYLRAVGYASITNQKGRTEAEKQVRAMRASKVDAYQELAEQVYGMRVSGRTQLDDQRMGKESTSGEVDGIIRGAEVVRSYKVGDSYVTELRLSIKKMQEMRQYGEVQQVPSEREQTLF